MKIGIIGAGMIGATTARLVARSGHEVAIANTRGPASLAELVHEIGPRARAATVDDAAAFGEIVLLAIPLGQYGTLPAEHLAGKIVVDAMNYYPQREGGRKQQPGTPIYNVPLTAAAARAALAGA